MIHIVLFIILLFIFVAVVYFVFTAIKIYRTEKICDFLQENLDKIPHNGKGVTQLYKEMLWSNKKLTVDNWFK